MGTVKIKKLEKVDVFVDKEIEISKDELIDIPYHPDYKLTKDGEIISFKKRTPRIIKGRCIDKCYISESYKLSLIEEHESLNMKVIELDKKSDMVNPIVIDNKHIKRMVNPIVIEKKLINGFNAKNFIDREMSI